MQSLPAHRLLTIGEYAAANGFHLERVKSWCRRDQLQPIACDARGRRLFRPDQRPHLTGPTEHRSHRFGGLLCTAGGPGKLRRVTLAERARDCAKHRSECGCELCLETVKAEHADRWRRAMDALADDQDEDSLESRWQTF